MTTLGAGIGEASDWRVAGSVADTARAPGAEAVAVPPTVVAVAVTWIGASSGESGSGYVRRPARVSGPRGTGIPPTATLETTDAPAGAVSAIASSEPPRKRGPSGAA